MSACPFCDGSGQVPVGFDEDGEQELDGCIECGGDGVLDEPELEDLELEVDGELIEDEEPGDDD